MTSDIKEVNLTLALPLRSLGNEKMAIRDKMNSLVSHYVQELDGILTKYDDLNILNDKGIIIDDQPYVFWKVSLTAHIFKLIPGKTIKGKVHEVQKCYFIAKAMNSFTVTVSIPENLANHEVVKNIMIEQVIFFKMKGCLAGVYRGELDEDCLELTRTNMEQEAMRESNVYDYAKDFEY